MRKTWAGMLLGIVLSGCATVSTAPRPDSYYGTASTSDAATPLFKSDASVLTDGDIQRILSYRLTLPRQNRIAVLRLPGASSWRYYSQDFGQLNEEIERDFIGTLRSSGRVYDVSYLPALLTPERQTVPYLREAAARYQADLLLIYRPRCASYDKYKFFSASETRAYCSVEAVLLDVRSAIVPFTAVSTNNVATSEAAGDMNMSEVSKRNELVAIGQSLGEVARKLVQYLEKSPASP